MKRIVISLFICISSLTVSAQFNNVFEGLAHVYEKIDKTPITTGLLIDQGQAFLDPSVYTGVSLNDPLMDYTKWREIYAEVYFSRVNGSLPNLMPIPEFNNFIDTFPLNTVPIGMMLINFQKIKRQLPSEVPYFTLTNNQLIDNPARLDNPYTSNVAFAVSPLVDFHGGGTLNFTIPSKLVINNYSASSNFSLEADFGDDNGYIPVNLDQNYKISYTSKGLKTLKFKLTVNGTTFISSSQILIKYPAIAASTINPITKGSECDGYFDETWHDIGFTTAEAYIKYATRQNQLTKPIIIAEGFDPQDQFNCEALYEALNNQSPNTNGLIEKLSSAGYDVVVLNFVDISKRSMKSNAAVMRRLINWVNASKVGHEPLVVGGVSMGGVIARYALRSMELDCEDHQTRLYISYDSPQQGANFPIGIQSLLKTANGITFGTIPEIKEQFDAQQSPAALELLLSHTEGVFGDPSVEHDKFYNELKVMGYPIKCRKIAVALGSLGTNTLDPTLTGKVITPGVEILKGFADNDLRYDLTAHAVSPNKEIEISKIRVSFSFIGLSYDFFNSKVFYKAKLPLDYAPGGVLNTQEQVADGLARQGNYQTHTTNNYNYHCIIPTVSALDISNLANNDLFYKDNKAHLLSAKLTPFDNILIHPFNNEHDGNVQTDANDFLFEEITGNNSLILINNIINSTYNYGGTTPTELTFNNLIVDENGLLTINKNSPTGNINGNPPSANTPFTLNLYDCQTLTIGSKGKLQLGDGVNPNQFIGNLIMHNGSTLHLKGGSNLTINNLSTLTIETGSTLIVDQGATITLVGDNSILDIQGNLIIGDNTIFTFNGSGFIKFSSALAPSNNVKIGQNVSLNFNGSGQTDKILEITQETLSFLENDLKSFSLTNGKVVLGNNSRLIPGSLTTQITLNNVLVTTSGNNKGRGIVVYGQDNMSITNSNFEKCNYGIYAYNTYHGASININNCSFSNCKTGLYTYDKGAVLNNCTFTNNEIGYSGNNMSLPANISNSIFTNNSEHGVYYRNSGGQLNMSGCVVNNNYLGVNLSNSNGRIQCSQVRFNSGTGLQVEGGAILQMDNSKSKFGSQVDVSGNKSFGIYLSGVRPNSLLINNGYNNFQTNQIGNNNRQDIVGSINIECTTPVNYPLIYNANHNNWNNCLPPSTATYVKLYTYTRSGFPCTQQYSDGIPVTYIDNATIRSVAACGSYPYSCSFIPPLPDDLCIACRTLKTPVFINIKIDAAVTMTLIEQINTKQFTTAIDWLNQILTYPIPNPSVEETKQLNIAYQLLLEAISGAYSSGQISASTGGGGIDARTQMVLNIQTDKIKALKSANSYFDYIYTTIDKARIYQLTNNINLAINELNSLIGFANNKEAELVQNLICLYTVQQKAISGEIKKEEVEGAVATCSLNYSSSYHTAKLGQIGNLKSKSFTESSVNIYPNPSSFETNISFDLIQDDVVSIDVYNVTGEKILSPFANKPCEIGNNIVSFENTGLSNGIYFIQIKTKENVINKKFIIQK